MKQQLISLDQLVNNWCFWWLPGGTWADETLSARAWRIRTEMPRLHIWIDKIFFWEKDHCYQSYQSEIARNQSPPESRVASKSTPQLELF